MRYNATPEALSYGHVPINTTWQEYDPLTWGIPSPAYHGKEQADTGKWPLPGVLIVDGDFIKQPLADALGNGVNSGVGLLVGNVGEECDLAHGARFSTDIYTDAIGFPHLLASSEPVCDQWHSFRASTALTGSHG
jgi:hypothetical protein